MKFVNGVKILLVRFSILTPHLPRPLLDPSDFPLPPFLDKKGSVMDLEVSEVLSCNKDEEPLSEVSKGVWFEEREELDSSFSVILCHIVAFGHLGLQPE